MLERFPPPTFSASLQWLAEEGERLRNEFVHFCACSDPDDSLSLVDRFGESMWVQDFTLKFKWQLSRFLSATESLCWLNDNEKLQMLASFTGPDSLEALLRLRDALTELSKWHLESRSCEDCNCEELMEDTEFPVIPWIEFGRAVESLRHALSDAAMQPVASALSKATGVDDSASAGAAGTKPHVLPANDRCKSFSDLLNWVKEELKGKQRRVLELVIQADGTFPLADIAVDKQIAWAPPYDNPFNSICKAVNPKLKTARKPWRLERNDNNARLAKIGHK